MARTLDTIISAERRTRDSVWAMVANTFAPLADPAVRATVSPGTADGFDPEAFLRGEGALFLLGTASGAAATSGLLAALVEDVVEAARHLAATSTAARLDPPLALVLDEAANYPLPSLSSLMSEGGGTVSAPPSCCSPWRRPATAGDGRRPRPYGTRPP